MPLTQSKTKLVNINKIKHKLYIGYLYFKRYALWVFLALLLLFILNILVKNAGQTNSSLPAQSSHASMIKELVVNVETDTDTGKQSASSSQLKSLKQQLLNEKEKNKRLKTILNNQELQITSALDEINQSFKNFNNDSQASNQISVLKSVSYEESEYYNKVKDALSKINPMNKKALEKLSTSDNDNSQKVNLSKKEG